MSAAIDIEREHEDLVLGAAERQANGADRELPPIECYASDPELIVGPRPLQTVDGARHAPIRIQTASEVALALPRSQWLLRPYLEHNAIVVVYADYGAFKTFTVVDWALRVALGLPALGHQWPTTPAPVIVISAEGRGLAQRLRAWCIRNFPDQQFQDVLERALLYCIEHPVNLSDPCSALALIAAIEALSIVPGLVIVDTMSRNSDGTVEESTASAGAYLAVIDQTLRGRFRCSVVLTHHVGHGEKGRMRGPIVLAANTDTLIRIERPDKAERLATLTVERMKDCEPPPPQGFRAAVVELGESDVDGQPITSLAIEASETVVAQPVSVTGVQLRGKAQRQLLAALRAQEDGARIWTIGDIREIGRKAGLHKNTARDAAEALTCTAHMVPTVGGWRLADA